MEAERIEKEENEKSRNWKMKWNQLWKRNQ